MLECVADLSLWRAGFVTTLRRTVLNRLAAAAFPWADWPLRTERRSGAGERPSSSPRSGADCRRPGLRRVECQSDAHSGPTTKTRRTRRVHSAARRALPRHRSNRGGGYQSENTGIPISAVLISMSRMLCPPFRAVDDCSATAWSVREVQSVVHPSETDLRQAAAPSKSRFAATDTAVILGTLRR